ncbi:hypothetical protein ABXT43_06590 [Candidatus Pelagibacter sp. Uisw_114]
MSTKFPKGVRYGNIVKNLLCEENTANNIYCSTCIGACPIE